MIDILIIVMLVLIVLLILSMNLTVLWFVYLIGGLASV